MVRLLLNAILATQPAPTVDLQLDACLASTHGIAAELLRDAVALEALDDAVPPGTRVQISCAAEGLTLLRTNPGPELARVLEVDPIDPAVRERVLALAVVELAIQRAPQPTTEPPEPRPPTPPTPDIPPAPSASSNVQLYFGGSARWFVPTTWLAGGQLGIRHYPRPHLGWSAAIDLGGARTRTSLGSISVISAAATLGLFGYQDLTHRVRIAAGAGMVLGWSHWWGVARRDAATAPLAGPWLGPWGDVRLDIALTPRWSLSIRTELGYAVVGVRALADRDTAATLAGLWVGASIGLGWTIPVTR